MYKLENLWEKWKKDEISIIADLTIGRKPFVDTYKSDVRYYKKNDTIHVTNIGGPLKHLENNWKFIEKDNFTEVHFDVDFEIKNKFLDMIMTKSFEFGLNKIADAFQKRAEKIWYFKLMNRWFLLLFWLSLFELQFFFLI